MLAEAADVGKHSSNGISKPAIKLVGMLGCRGESKQAFEHVGIEIDAEQVGPAEIIIAAEPYRAGSGAPRLVLQCSDESRSVPAPLFRWIDDQRMQLPAEAGMPDRADPTDQPIAIEGG